MTKYIQITKNTWIAFAITLVTFLMIVSVSHAQTASSSADQVAARYGVSFPIAALGNCTDMNSCRAFCDDPVNKDACIAFAKSKGFYKEDALTTQKQSILAKAKAALGCDSETSCLNFCAIQENQDKCSSFAQSTQLQGGVVVNPNNQAIINQAKQVLGCSSEAACQTLCEQDTNKAKCAEFANQVGLRGGDEKVGPGGCTSEQTCQAFCSNPTNYQICSGFTHSIGGNFSGPGGCNSPQSCQTYCQQNPQSCPGFSGSGQNSQSGSNPAETCDSTPNCSWTGSTCFCGNNTNNQGGTTTDRVAMCARYGCSWTGNVCQCNNIGNSYNTAVYFDTNLSYSQQEATCKAGGGTCASGSTTTFCNCQGYTSPVSSSNPSSSPSPASSSYNSSPHYCPNTCNSGYGPDPNQNCTCIPVSQSCQPPAGGCGSNNYYDYSRCGCYPNSSTTPSSSSQSCQPPSSGCGPNSYYDYSRCGCYQNSPSSSSPGTSQSCQPPAGGCGSNNYYDYSRCGCYPNSSTTPSSSSQSCQPPSSGCGPNSYYDYSRCGCYQNSPSTPAPSTSNSSSPSTAPSSSNPSSAPSPTPASSGTVKGVSTDGGFWSFFKNIFNF